MLSVEIVRVGWAKGAATPMLRLQSHIHVKFDGFVEHVFVNFVGRKVNKGESLLSVYSPELLAAETELSQAYTDRDRPRTGRAWLLDVRHVVRVT